MPNPTDLAKPLLALFLLSLAIRVLTALPQHHPHNMDEAYHTVNAITPSLLYVNFLIRIYRS